MMLAVTMDSWEAFLGFGTALGGTCAYLVWVASRVDRWRKKEQSRNVTVDVINADLTERGLTPQGAIKEAADYRDAVDNHTSAIADTKRRVDEVEIRLAAAEVTQTRHSEALVNLNERADDADTAIRNVRREDTP